MTSPSVSYKRHRFPPAIIAHAVCVYFRFPLSLRLVEEMLHERGIVVSYETVRRWAMKFGRDYARRLKRKRASRRDIWHLDEVVVTIGGIGSIRGAFIAAMLVGIVDTIGRAFVPDLLHTYLSEAAASSLGRALSSMLIYLLMALVLVVRPAGLFPAAAR